MALESVWLNARRRLAKDCFQLPKKSPFITGGPMRSKDEAVHLSRTSPWTTFYWANSPQASLIVSFKGPTLVERSRLVKAIMILFMECLHTSSVYQYKIILRYSHFSHMSADPAFSLRFLASGSSRVLEAFQPSYPPSVVPSAWDSGCARISFPSPRFP